MAVRLLPDVEALAIQYLKQDADLAAVAGTAGVARVHSKLPREPTLPLVRLFRTPGTVPVRQHLVAARLQVESWAKDKKLAWRVAETARAVLHNTPQTVHALGVVSGVDDILDLRWEPDSETELARYLFEVAVYVHPIPD